MEVYLHRVTKRRSPITELSGLIFSEEVIRERSFTSLSHTGQYNALFKDAVDRRSLPRTLEPSSHRPSHRPPQRPLYRIRPPSQHQVNLIPTQTTQGMLQYECNLRRPYAISNTAKETAVVLPEIFNVDLHSSTSSLSLKSPETVPKIPLKDFSSSRVLGEENLPVSKICNSDIKTSSTSSHILKLKSNTQEGSVKVTSISDGTTQRVPCLWDELVLCRLSEHTATMLTQSRRTSLARRTRLEDFMSGRKSVRAENTRTRSSEDVERGTTRQTNTHTASRTPWMTYRERFTECINEKMKQTEKKENEEEIKEPNLQIKLNEINKEEIIKRVNKWNQRNNNRCGDQVANSRSISRLTYHETRNGSHSLTIDHNQMMIEIVEDLKCCLPYALTFDLERISADDVITDLSDEDLSIRISSVLMSASMMCEGGAEEKRKLRAGLECCLCDDEEVIRQAAAIVLCLLEEPALQVKQILINSIRDRNHLSSLSAQCLAIHGWSDNIVIETLIQDLMFTKDNEIKQRIMNLLLHAPHESNLTQSLLGEKLSSERERERVRAAECLSYMSALNSDVKDRLNELLWSDWSSDVREIALSALRHHVTRILDDVRVRILSADESVRTEAVKTVGLLGKMPENLTYDLLKLFDDESSKVREEMCNISEVLVKNTPVKERVENTITSLVDSDSSSKVRLAAVKAVQRLFMTSQSVRPCLLRAACQDREPAVRAESCKVLSHLNMLDESAIRALRDQILVEPEESVKRCMEELLLSRGSLLVDEEREMLNGIIARVQQLCDVTEVWKGIERQENKQLEVK